MAFPESWSEVALVSIARSGAADFTFAPIVETIDIDEGDNDVEFIATVRGGRIAKQIPKAETTITFEAYPVGTGSTQLSDGLAHFFQGDISDSSEPISITNLRGRKIDGSTTSNIRFQFRVAILFTDDTAATLASGATAASTNSYRYSAINCYLVGYKQSFTDGILKVTMTFKVAAFNKSGTGNIIIEQGNATALSALTSYTAS